MSCNSKLQLAVRFPNFKTQCVAHSVVWVCHAWFGSLKTFLLFGKEADSCNCKTKIVKSFGEKRKVKKKTFLQKFLMLDATVLTEEIIYLFFKIIFGLAFLSLDIFDVYTVWHAARQKYQSFTFTFSHFGSKHHFWRQLRQ